MQFKFAAAAKMKVGLLRQVASGDPGAWLPAEDSTRLAPTP